MGHEGIERAGCARLNGGTLLRANGRRLAGWSIVATMAAAIFGAFTGTAQAQLVRPGERVTYTNRYDIYGGIALDTLVAGRTLLKRMNLGGFEAQGTYWVFPRVGLGVDLRGDGGTTPVNANPYKIDRAVVYQQMYLGGVQVRGPRNQHFALNYHGYFGVTHGMFDTNIGNTPPQNVGLYTNRTKPMAALGVSLDINRGAHWALRIQPDAMVRRYDSTETTEDFSMSAGILYRFGKR